MTFSLKRSSLTRGVIAVAAGCALLGTAHAGIMYLAGTGTNGNANQSATATFSFSSPGSFSLILDNTGSVAGIASVLDGFNFNQMGLNGIALTSISSTDGLVTCTSSSATTGSCVDASGGMQTVTDWSVSSSGSAVSMTAGSGLHPYGIVNDSADTWVQNNGKQGGLTNGQHNPYLEGPVTFNFSVGPDSMLPTVTDFQFLFGTTPDVIDGFCTSDNQCSPNLPPVATPEPGALAMFAAGLLGCALFINRRRRASRQS